MKLRDMDAIDVLLNIKEELIYNIQIIIPDTIVRVESDYSELFFDLRIEFGYSKSIILEIFINLSDNNKNIIEIIINSNNLLKLYTYHISELSIEKFVFQIYIDFIYNNLLIIKANMKH